MYIFPCKRIRYIKPITINTHINCLNNSKYSVRYIFNATKQGALKVTLHHFLLPSSITLKASLKDLGLQIIYLDKLEGSQFNLICHELFDQHSYILQTYKRYTLAIFRFPLVNTSEPQRQLYILPSTRKTRTISDLYLIQNWFCEQNAH